MLNRDLDEAKIESTVQQVRDLLASGDKTLRSFLYRDILLNALKAGQDQLDVLDLKVLNLSMAEFRYAARVFKPYRNVRNVSIFGSARTPPDDPYYLMAVEFSRMLTEMGYIVITGAAQGIMGAGIEGAGAAKSFGVNIHLLFESVPYQSIQDDPKLITFRYFFTRKIFFVMEADAFALFPGGFGTHDEAFEVLTLMQTGKTPLAPLVFCELPGERYWEAWDAFVREQMLARGYISPEDLNLYKISHSAREAADWIKHHYSTYHSMRQVYDTLVIRLERELNDDHIRRLSEEFRDIIKAGEITRTAPLPQEADEPDLMVKPRIAFQYTRRSAGRLNELVAAVNRYGSEQ